MRAAAAAWQEPIREWESEMHEFPNHETNLFWEDLTEDLKDPEFLQEYIRVSTWIAMVDKVANS